MASRVAALTNRAIALMLLATFGRCLAWHGDGDQGERRDKDKREEGAAREGW